MPERRNKNRRDNSLSNAFGLTVAFLSASMTIGTLVSLLVYPTYM